MACSTLRHDSFDGGRRLAALWAGLATGPLAWAAQLQVNYMLSYVACEQRETWMLHLTSALALAVIGGAAFIAWRAAPAAREAAADANGGAIPVQRARFMAIGGLILCAFFAIVVLATELPALMLDPCAW